MELKLQHAVIRVTSIENAKDFYLNKVGIELLEDFDGNACFFS